MHTKPINPKEFHLPHISKQFLNYGIWKRVNTNMIQPQHTLDERWINWHLVEQVKHFTLDSPLKKKYYQSSLYIFGLVLNSSVILMVTILFFISNDGVIQYQ